jgi:hypothetical protein
MMSVTRAMFPYSSVSQIFLAPSPVSDSTSEISKLKLKSQFLRNQRLEVFSTSLNLLYARNTKMYGLFSFCKTFLGITLIMQMQISCSSESNACNGAQGNGCIQ